MKTNGFTPNPKRQAADTEVQNSRLTTNFFNHEFFK